MKKFILYFLLLTYSTVTFKPAIPFVKDLIAHVLFFEDHMHKVHSHNGQSHAHDELAKAAKEDQSEKSTNNSKKFSSETEFLNVEGFKSAEDKHITPRLSSNACLLVSTNLNGDFPPPRPKFL